MVRTVDIAADHMTDGSGSARKAEAALFLVFVALPLAFTPFSAEPFVNPKLLVLLVATALLASARITVRPRIAMACGVWVLALAVSGLAGHDPLWSLLGSENRGVGILAFAAGAYLLCAGTGVDERVKAKLPAWLFWAGAAVAAVAVIARFVNIGGPQWQLGNLSATLGHRVYAGGAIAAAIVAAPAIHHRWARTIGLLILGSGLAVTAVRSAWIGCAIGLVVIALRTPSHRRTVLAVLAPVALALAAWTVADSFIPANTIEFSAAPRFAQLDEGSAQERIPVLRANVRAWQDRPVLGSGPATGWHGYLTHATASEVGNSGRGFTDAHNLAVESLATTGLLGFLALVALAIFVILGLPRRPAAPEWPLAVALTLATFHMFQPVNLVLTSWMFLAAGLATNNPRLATQRLPRWPLVGVFVVATLLSVNRFVASSLEWYGATYASGPSFEWSLRFEPWRLSSSVSYAKFRSFDHRNGDPDAAGDIQAVMTAAIRRHSWSPSVRLSAADVAVVVDDLDRARELIDDHLRTFPNDPLALAGGAAVAVRSGDHDRAITLARRALTIDPKSGLANSALQAAMKAKRKGDASDAEP